MSKGNAILLICLGLLPLSASTQTIDEITTLQRKKLVSDLMKDINGGTVAPASAPAAAPVKREIVRPVVVGISGDPADGARRTVAVIEAERAPADYRIGDITAEGWRVTAIGSRSATFANTRANRTGPSTVTVEYGSANISGAPAGTRPAAAPAPAAPTPATPART